MTHLASPQRRKAKNNIKVTDRQLYLNIIIPPTLLLFKQKRTEVQIIFIYNLHIYLDWFWPWLGECPPACWPQIKRLSDTQLTSVPAICCGYLTLNVRMSGVTSPLRCSAALLRQIICTFSVAGSPQSTLTGRPPSPGGDILEQAFSVYWSAAAVLIMEKLTIRFVRLQVPSSGEYFCYYNSTCRCVSKSTV